MKAKEIKEKLVKLMFFLAALASVFAVLLICGFLFTQGIPIIKEIGFVSFLFGKEWSPNDVPPLFGIFPMILGSFYITAGAVIVGVPIGVFTAVYMSYMCSPKMYGVLKPVVELLAGIPSVIYGFFGMVIIVPFVARMAEFLKVESGTGSSILAASILLGIMILPTVISISESALNAVPKSYYEGSLALGATRIRSIFFTVVPAAKSGIMAGIVLGVGRAIGETMAVIMVAGNQAIMPSSIFKGVRTLTANIVIEMSYAGEFHRGALIATGVVLFVFILIINLFFSVLKRRLD